MSVSTYTTTQSVLVEDDIVAGDIVAVRYGPTGRAEGIVIGSHIDHAGRQVIQVRLDNHQIHHAPWPEVTRVRRTISYALPSAPHKARTVERRIYW